MTRCGSQSLQLTPQADFVCIQAGANSVIDNRSITWLPYENNLATSNYSAGSYASAEYWIYYTEQFGGVHAFGYNSAESEPIWIKSRALWVHCWGLALGAIRVAATVWEAAEIFFYLVNNARFRRFPSRNFNTTTSIDEALKTFGTEFC